MRIVTGRVIRDGREHVHPRFYDDQGNTPDQLHQLNGDTYTVGDGEVCSPILHRGTSDDCGDVLTGGWVPSLGGGYDAVRTRTTS